MSRQANGLAVKIILIILFSILLSSCLVKPNVITEKEHTERVLSDLKNMFADQQKVHRLSPYQAMARAIKYNLDYRLKQMEAIISRNEFDLSQYDMLPQLVADAGFIHRSNFQAASSFNLVTNTPNIGLGFSTSTDLSRRIANLQLSWNILDFGASYFSAKQKADIYLIARERHRKMIQNIIRDVRYAYWRAYAAERLIPKLNHLERTVNHALAESREIEFSKTQNPLDSLQYQKHLMEILRKSVALEKDLFNAKAELSALINLPPGTRLNLRAPLRNAVLPKNFPHNLKLLEKVALRDRPELHEEAYRKRIDINEIYKARLQLLPGLNLYAGRDYDSNSFTLNKSWAEAGFNLTYNLLRLLAAPALNQKVTLTAKASDIRRLALAMTVMTQVDIAYLRYRQTLKELSINKKALRIDQQIYRHVSNQVRAQKGKRLDKIKAEAELILSELRVDLAYAEWQNSGGQLLNSIGYDPIENINPEWSLSEISEIIHKNLSVTPKQISFDSTLKTVKVKPNRKNLKPKHKGKV